MVPNGLRTPFPEASIVFRGASLIGEAGENDVVPAVFHKTCHLLKFARFIW